MKRSKHPPLSVDGEQALAAYTQYLQQEQDLRPATQRSYLSELRLFIAWYEHTWGQGQETAMDFTPSAIATPAVTQYRSYLQTVLRLKPATINRCLVGLKRYFAWAAESGVIQRDPARVVKLLPLPTLPPRHLSDQEENALMAAVTTHGSLRDRTILTLLLHTGLRAMEVCALRRADLTLGKRSGSVTVLGKRQKMREVPLNITARETLATYLPTLPPNAPALFLSEKTGLALTERALGYIIHKYAQFARITKLSPHDLRHRFGYRMAESVPLHRLAQIMGHDSLDTTMLYVRGTTRDLQNEVEKIAWA